MKFPDLAIPTRQPVPSLGGKRVRHRPVLAVLLTGTGTPQLRDGLLDTGADDTVFSDAVAVAVGGGNHSRAEALHLACRRPTHSQVSHKSWQACS